MNLTVRPISGEDLPRFAAVLEADPHLPCAYLPAASQAGLAAMQREALAHGAAREGAALVGLQVNGAPVGVAFCEPLPFDSEHLGRPTGRVTALHANVPWPLEEDYKAALLGACVEHARREGWQCMDLQTSLEDLASANAASDKGFFLTATNLGIVWELDKAIPKVPATQAEVARAEPADAQEVGVLAAAAVDRYSRFAMDPRLPRDAAPRVFAAWAGNSVRGYADLVHVARLEGRIVGYCTWRVVRAAAEHLGLNYARLDLCAVHPDARGGHVLTALARAGLVHWQAQGFRYASVATHALNAGMQRACGGLLGGRTRFARHSFHWHETGRAGA